MKIRDLYATGKRVFSFEFFPPKTDKGAQTLQRTIQELSDLAPGFVSVTYGAGGSTRDLTIDLVSRIQKQDGLTAMAHLTCVGAGRSEIAGVLDRLVTAGIENVIALRGDPPDRPDALPDAPRRLRPRLRPHRLHSPGVRRPPLPRRRRLPRGAHRVPGPGRATSSTWTARCAPASTCIITQLFFDNRCYFDFVARARAAGITVPIVPGIMPITNLASVERMTVLSGAQIPPALRTELDRRRDDPAAIMQLGLAQAAAQCADLLHAGAPGIHFYTLNQSPATRMILTALKGARAGMSQSV